MCSCQGAINGLDQFARLAPICCKFDDNERGGVVIGIIIGEDDAIGADNFLISSEIGHMLDVGIATLVIIGVGVESRRE